MKSISYWKFADRFLAYTHRGKYILDCITNSIVINDCFHD